MLAVPSVNATIVAVRRLTDNSIRTPQTSFVPTVRPMSRGDSVNALGPQSFVRIVSLSSGLASSESREHPHAAGDDDDADECEHHDEQRRHTWSD